jgi:hypothetical protein
MDELEEARQKVLRRNQGKAPQMPTEVSTGSAEIPLVVGSGEDLSALNAFDQRSISDAITELLRQKPREPHSIEVDDYSTIR